MFVSFGKQYFRIASLLFFVFLLCGCKDCETVMVDYIESEPYTELETTEETLSYTVIGGNLQYERIPGATLFDRKPKIRIKCDIENTGSQAGFFRIYANISSSDGQLYLSGDAQIEPGRIRTIYATEEIGHYTFEDFTVDDWKVIPPTVTTQKNVTKYREVSKQRPCKTCEENCN